MNLDVGAERFRRDLGVQLARRTRIQNRRRAVDSEMERVTARLEALEERFEVLEGQQLELENEDRLVYARIRLARAKVAEARVRHDAELDELLGRVDDALRANIPENDNPQPQQAAEHAADNPRAAPGPVRRERRGRA